MKCTFSTLACQDLSYKEIAEYALQSNMDALEVRLHKGNRLFDLPISEVPEAVAYLESKGIRILDLGTNVDFTNYDPEMMQLARECVDVAALAKAKGIRVFLGTCIKRFSQPRRENYEGIVKSLKEICEYAQPKGVEIWVEMHYAFSTGEVLKKVLDDVDRDNLKIIWDIIHSLEFGEKPADTLAYLGDKIAHIHVKDGFKKEDPDEIVFHYTKLGEGTLPIREMYGLLEQAGYDGYYSFEWENAWREEIRDAFQNLGQILEHYTSFMDEIKKG